MTTRELTLGIARRILENVEAGRIYAAHVVAWARRTVASHDGL